MNALIGNSDSEAATIGQSLLDLSARLPEGHRERGDGERMQADLYVSFEAGDDVWEIEFCALDGNRNFTDRDSDLAALLSRSLARDREKAPDV